MHKHSYMPILLLVLCLTLAIPTPAAADEAKGHLRSGPEIAYQVANFRYREPGIMKETGVMHGIYAGYTHHFDSGFMGRLEGDFLVGELDYDGSYWNGTPVTSDTDDWVVEARALGGWDFVFEKWALTPFAGLGYRYWYDDIKVTGGYEREISYLYMPIGAETSSRVGKWLWGVRGEYDLFLGGMAKSHLSQAVAGYNNPENEQGFADGYGLRASVYMAYEFEDGYFVSLEPFYRYWNVKESETEDLTQYGTKIGTVVEPKNNTRVLGLKAAILF